MTPFGHFGAGADEAIVLDDHRTGLERLEHAANPRAAGNMDVSSDLRAAADRCPCVDHRPLADISAEIDEAGHQHRARGDIGAAADDRPGTARKPALAKLSAVQPRTLTAPCPTMALRLARLGWLPSD
jgi:hypothetical protein